ncbi:hypothetical protein CON29_16395 [Bacillus thuringiensis]|nr:hypothetical protein CON29_16395 [Bacillus thuringiensis]
MCLRYIGIKKGSFGIPFFLSGVSPAFRKKPTLRVCKILYSFWANTVTNENPKTHARIGMYKMMHRITQKENAQTFDTIGFVRFLCYR